MGKTATSDKLPMRTMLKAAITSSPTPTPRSRADHGAGNARTAPRQSAMASPPLQLAST